MKNLLLLLFALAISSCYYDNEEDLYGTAECDTMDVTFSNTVLPILEDNCYGCHDDANNVANISIEGYDKLKPFVDSGQLLGVIKWESGFSPMPKNLPQLVQCDIEKIETWINDGALNN